MNEPLYTLIYAINSLFIICFLFQQIIQDAPALADAVRAKMIDTFLRISKEAAEEFTNRQEEISEAKKID